MKAHNFKIGDRVEFAHNGDFEEYSGSTDNELYDQGVVVDDGIYIDVLWDSDGEVTCPVTRALRKIDSNESRTRPHANLIKAWADGADIEQLDRATLIWEPIAVPVWDPMTRYRIKPDIPDPIVRTMFVEAHPNLDNAHDKPNLKLTFDGVSFKLIKVEIIEEK